MSHSTDGVRNGHIQIHVSEDQMTAEVDLFPPVSGGEGFTIMSLVSELEAAGVVWGIDREGLEKAILRCLTEEEILRGVPAAKGRRAVKSVPSYWHLKKRLLNRPDTDLDSPSVDYRDHSPYVLVKKGEALAKMIPESPGEPGKNIAGSVLPVSEKDIVSYKPGENIIEKDGVLYAAAFGRFEIRDREMTVNETLDIAGNVDYSTGHIAFPGDVIIHGAVCDGFQVAAGKSIFVKQTMDASRVLSRGDLVVEGGIKGRGEALIRVDGRIVAKFIENATLEAHGEITVEKAMMHSNAFTLKWIDAGEAGVLVGGEIWAAEGIRAGRIGRPESPSAVIRVGSDYIVDRKLISIREQVDRLEMKLDKLKAKSTINAEREKLINQVETVIGKLRETESGLVDKQHWNTKARLTVLGEVMEGTEIHICELSLRVSSSMEGVVFYYESDGPRIATRSIVDSDKGPMDAGFPAEAGSDSGIGNRDAAASEEAAMPENRAGGKTADGDDPSENDRTES